MAFVRFRAPLHREQPRKSGEDAAGPQNSVAVSKTSILGTRWLFKNDWRSWHFFRKKLRRVGAQPFALASGLDVVGPRAACVQMGKCKYGSSALQVAAAGTPADNTLALVRIVWI
jgi:hypothetical protein